MERNMTLTADVTNGKQSELTEFLASVKTWISTPVKLLSQYYSSVLEREVTNRQTWLIIEAQAAFFAGIFPADIHITARLLMAAWFLSSLSRCRKSLKTEN